MRRIIGRMIEGKWVRVDEPVERDDEPDYFHGVAPSDLGQLSNRALYIHAERLYTALEEGRGTVAELDKAAEAYEECVRERKRRIQTLR